MRYVATFLALALLHLAAPSTATAGFEEGDQAFHRGDFPAARRAWREPAEAGHAGARYGLGRLLLAHAEPEGLQWILASAEAGHLPAELRMAFFHLNGLYAPMIPQHCVEWLRRATSHDPDVEAAHPVDASYAHFMLGNAFFHGYGVPMDEAKGAEQFKLSADAGNAAAQFAYGQALEGGKGVERDLVEAYKYYVLSWKQGHVEHMFGMPVDSGKIRTLAVRKQLSPEQLADATSRARSWLIARNEGTLGRVFDHEKKRSRGEERLEECDGQVFYALSLMTMLARSPDCVGPWLTERRATRGSPDDRSWAEVWTFDACGEQKVIPVDFRRMPDGQFMVSLKPQAAAPAGTGP